MSVNSRCKATEIMCQTKTFYQQRIPESSCSRKITVDIDILVKSRNGDRKILQSLKNNECPSLMNREVKPVEPVKMNIYQSNTYRKNLSCLHFDNEPSVQEKQQVEDQQYLLHISFCSLSNNSKWQLGAPSQT